MDNQVRGTGWRGENKGKSCAYAQCAALHRIIIQVEEIQESVTASGIVMVKEVTDKENLASMFARVLAIGSEAWADKSMDACDVGDKILIGRYVGTRIQKTDDVDVRVISDLDILGIVEYAA